MRTHHTTGRIRYSFCSHRNTFLLLLFGTTYLTPAFPQASSFGVAYGGTGYDVSHWAEIAASGNFIMTGETYSFGSGTDDIYVGETDKTTGAIAWSKAYGTSASERSNCIRKTSDGGYVVCGYTGVNGPYDMLLLKIDASGNLSWAKSYGGSSGEVAQSVLQTSDGGFLIIGETSNYSSTLNTEMYVVKTDNTGAMLWDHTYGVSGFLSDQGVDAAQVSGGYVIMGQTSTPGYTDVALLKINTSGTVLWSYRYNFVNYDEPNYFIQTSDGGFLVTGYANTGAQTDIFLLKTDADGIVQWAKTYGDVYENRGWEVIQTADGGYAVTGTWRAAFVTGNDFFILKTDASGVGQWLNMMGASEDEIAEAGIRQTSDGGYAVSGFTCCGSVGPGDRDYMVYKTDDEGDIFGTCNVVIPSYTTATPSVSEISITLQSQTFGSAGTPSITITTPPSQNVILCSPVLLPVELMSFSGQLGEVGVELSWRTATEINNDYFVIERSIDGNVFAAIQSVQGAGTSLEEHEYNYTDKLAASGVNYYRLKQTGSDGHYSYSNVVAVDVVFSSALQVIAITYNPAIESFQVSFSTGEDQRTSATVHGALGQLLTAWEFGHQRKGFHSESVDVSQLSSGLYWIQVRAGNESRTVQVLKPE